MNGIKPMNVGIDFLLIIYVYSSCEKRCQITSRRPYWGFQDFSSFANGLFSYADILGPP